MNEAIQRYEDPGPMSVEKMKEQVNLIQHVLQKVMIKDVHYGKIPGCGDKPTLLKPGAEKICLTFRLSPSYDIIQVETNTEDHREYRVVCTLTHIPSGQVFGEGVGSCSTMEGKYRFRTATRVCPACGAEAIIKGKAEYGGGWLCFKKKDGCGEKFDIDDPVIQEQETGKMEHDNPADYYNTVLKMAKKRAQVDATLTATAASDIFTQDIEDMPEVIPGAKEKPEVEVEDDIPLDHRISEKQVKRMFTIAKEQGWEDTAVKSLVAEYGYESSKDISKEKYKLIIEQLQKVSFVDK